MKPTSYESDDCRNNGYKVISFKRPQEHYFLRLNLSIDEVEVSSLDATQYKFIIVQALKENLGKMGESLPVDVLKRLEGGQALVRVPGRHAEKIWAALTLYGASPTHKRCAFTVLQASPFLMGLAFESRNRS